MAVDEAGRPLRMIITEGQVSDISCAHELVEHLRTGAVIADKGYDSDAFVNTIRATRAKAVIPPRSNRETKLQSHQTFSSRLHSLRRARGQLSRLRGACLRLWATRENVNRTFYEQQFVKPLSSEPLDGCVRPSASSQNGWFLLQSAAVV
ncbi:transposase [Burkholderia multivorans]|nr:transposase [Burkholderia multivorans]MDN8000972.1 transposase [Burkholderia multivorans]